MKEKSRSLEIGMVRGIAQSLRLAAENNEFQCFWLLGVLLHGIAFRTFNTWGWLAIGAADWCVGALAVATTIRGVETALASCGVSFASAHGSPRWILAKRYPCASDTIEFTACGHPAESYQQHVGRISAGLNLPVQSITEDRPGAQILQAHIVRTQIPSKVDFSEIDLNRLGQRQFVYGKDEHGFKFDNLKDAIHFVVAGQTGSGKTFFSQQLTLTILKRSHEAHAVIIDMKGGIDFQDFKRLPNCELVTTHEDAHVALDALFRIHELRTTYLTEKGKRNWHDLSLKETAALERFARVPVGPILLLADELAELTGYRKGSKLKESVHQRLSQLGRLARATGIHLIASTQRPDRTIIDGQTKQSFVTKVCFAVPSVAASTIVVDNMSAFTIGRHPGRAVVATGTDRQFVQTPYLSPEALKTQVDALRTLLEHKKYQRKVIGAVDPATATEAKDELTDEPEAP